MQNMQDMQNAQNVQDVQKVQKMQKIHLKAPNNWINDPNGFIYYKGEYHLFYQYFPYAVQWGSPFWGHAVSKDLVNWRHLDIALLPTVRGDQNGCFSGSAIEHEGKMHIVYTGVRYDEIDPDNIYVSKNGKFEATQMSITSEDGYHFDNWKGKKVIIPPITDNTIGHWNHTRDPKIWRGSDAWYLILGSTINEEKGEVLFYRSEDLEHWTYVNQVIPGPSIGYICECPDYFEVEGGKVLLASAMGIPKPGERIQDHSICYLVDFEEKTCNMDIPDEFQYVDYGLDLYAPQTTTDKDGNRVMVAWLRMPTPVDDKWIGMFCAPRLVEVKNNHIYFPLHPAIREAFGKAIELEADAAQRYTVQEDAATVQEDAIQEDGVQQDAVQQEKEGQVVLVHQGNQEKKQNQINTMHVHLADKIKDSQYRIEMELDNEEQIKVGGVKIYREENKLYVDRRKVYPSGQLGEHLLSITPEIKDGNKLEILVEENVIEIFVNDGEYVISNIVYGLSDEIIANISGEMKLYTLN